MRPDRKKHYIYFGSFCLAIFIASIFLSMRGTADVSLETLSALQSQEAKKLSPGTVFLDEDKKIDALDHVILHDSQKEKTTIWIWDFADHDGDYVQVLADGNPLSDPFMIKNRAKKLSVPSEAVIQIKGIKDGNGGEGITYAIKFEANDVSYLNSIDEGKHSTFELKRK